MESVELENLIIEKNEMTRTFHAFREYVFDNYLELKETDYFKNENEVNALLSFIIDMWNKYLTIDERRSLDYFSDEKLLNYFEDLDIDFDWIYHHVQKEINPVKKNKIGRNDLCICGSGKKYKKCCIRSKSAEIMTSSDFELLNKYLIQSILLLDYAEFDDFHFKIDLQDEQVNEIIGLFEDNEITPEFYLTKFVPAASELLEKIFTDEQRFQILKILNLIQSKYKLGQKMSNIMRAAIFFLEDKAAKHHALPLLEMLLYDEFLTILDIDLIKTTA